jgi:hypothetical protein
VLQIFLPDSTPFVTGSQSTNISSPSGVLVEYRWRYSFETDFIAVRAYLLSESHINAATDFNTCASQFLDTFTK